jgi:hypothetical protein
LQNFGQGIWHTKLGSFEVLGIRNRRTLTGLAFAVAAGSSLALTVVGTGAAATTYTVPLHQTPPITAAGFGSQSTDCPGIPTSEDGWNFVLPGDFTVFVKLTVTFNTGTQIITTFGPPSDKHANVGTAPGAILESASAIVETQTGKKKVLWFNLSHTCPASTSTGPTPTPTVTVTVTPTATVSVTPSQTITPTGTPSVTPSESPTSPSPSPSESESPAPTPTPESGELPVTG